MSLKTPYSYTVLRYVHDVVAGEYMNVGVVLYAPQAECLICRVRKSAGSRMRKAFPDMDTSAFRQSMKQIRRAINSQARKHAGQSLLSDGLNAGTFARAVIRDDDSSLQWSSIGTGLTEDPRDELDRLYNRFVGQYDVKVKARKSDEDVWRPVQHMLAERKIDIHFTEKVVRGKTDEIAFERAWKNGIWHCYEPLTMDLANADNIKDKARRWLGHLTAVNADEEQFHTYLIIGKPSNSALMSAYNQALSILEECPGRTDIYEEDKIGLLVEEIENEVRGHQIIN